MRFVVFGCSGPVGIGVMEALAPLGEVIGISRTGRSESPPGAHIVAGDAADREQAVRLATGASVVFGCMGLPYREWPEKWPAIVDGLIAAAEHAGARLVFADNVYSYGPPTGPLREDTPLTSYGRKPALRAAMTRTLLDAHAKGRARVALVRASDFYGPRTTNAILGAQVFARMLSGKSAQFIGNVDQPHTFAYVPDVVRALVTVSQHEDAFGQVWHSPSAPPVTPRRVVTMLAAMLSRAPKISVLPTWLLPVVGLFAPQLGELRELMYQFERPFVVDDAKFVTRFQAHATPLEDGLRATVEWYRARGKDTNAQVAAS